MNIWGVLFRLVKKSKILHVVYWGYAFISLYHETARHHALPMVPHLAMTINTILWQAICVYFIILWLVPRYFNKRFYSRFVLFSMITIAVSSFLLVSCENIIDVVLLNKHLFSYIISIASQATDMALQAAVFFAVITIPKTYLTDKRNKELEKERLETELNFLKSQINPHFLFNALNSIYVLIEEDTRSASDTLLKFSDMLRYQLYECSGQRVSLRKELTFLHDYAGLEQIRNSEQIKVNFYIGDDVQDLVLPPFLLLPFVENAFKHISHYTDQSNYINVSMSVDQHVFTACIVNTYEELPKYYNNKNGGIGLQNVRRRLELLYPDKHVLDIRANNGLYTIDLKLDIYGDEMYPGRR